MIIFIIITVAVLVLMGIILFKLFTSWGNSWGATPEECARQMIGDAYLAGGPPARIAMTRAVYISQPPEVVWPWLEQLGRGAGWYSYESLDNGGKTSARHLVSWIPAPQLGDASPIGYLGFLAPGRELVWWLGGLQSLGSRFRMVNDLQITPANSGSRLVIRISADATGLVARPVLWVFQVIDTIMARRQLLGIKGRVEAYGTRTVDPEHPEDGRRDQYQLYEVIYASGQTAGVRGKERASLWRSMALQDKVLAASEEGPTELPLKE